MCHYWGLIVLVLSLSDHAVSAQQEKTRDGALGVVDGSHKTPTKNRSASAARFLGERADRMAARPAVE